MLAPLLAKMGRRIGTPPTFLLHWLVFLYFRQSDSTLAPFWFHLGGSAPHPGSIWKVRGAIMVPSWRYLGPLEREIERNTKGEREREQHNKERYQNLVIKT